MLGNARQSKCSSLLDRWVEFFEAVNKSLKSSRVNDSLSKVWRVLGNGSEDVGGSFFVETLSKFKFSITVYVVNGNLRFAQRGSRRAVGGSRWRRQLQPIRQSSWRVFQEQEQLTAGCLERYRGEVVSREP